MFESDDTLQRQLFAFTPRDLLPENSDVFLYEDLFDALDLDDFDANYSSQGQSSPDPKLILRTIFFGLTHGVSSGRKLEAACKYDSRYIVLSGAKSPSYRLFSRFLSRHEQQIDQLFVQVVRVAQQAGLVKLGRVAIDGTRLKAYTSNSRSLKYEKLGRAIERIREELEELKKSLTSENHASETDDTTIPKEIRSKEVRLSKIMQAKRRLEKEAAEKGREPRPEAQVSVNDPDARSIGSRRDRFVMGYNAQAAVDGQAQIVVSAEIHDANNDLESLKNTLDSVKENCGNDPQSILADAGYGSTGNLEHTKDRGIDPYISFNKEAQRERLDDLTPTDDATGYHCPAGHRLRSHRVSSKKHGARDAMRLYLPTESCGTCSVSCRLRSDRGHIQVPTLPDRDLLVHQTHRMKTEEFQEIYKYRKAIVEPVFGNLKHNKGLRLAVTTRRKVSVWWKMICTAHNIEKLIGKGFAPMPA